MRSRVLTLATVVGLTVVVLPTLPASAKGLSQSQIQSLENSIKANKNLTFEAMYTAVSGGQKQTVTIAQAPHKSYFGASNGSVINDGKSTYYCSTSGSTGSSGTTGSTGNTGNSPSTPPTTKTGQPQCVKQSGVSPLLGLQQLFNSSTALTALNEATKHGLLARALGVHVSASNGSYGGQSATCFSVTAHGHGGKYCITKQGVLAYVSTGSNDYFELTMFSSKPSPSLFELPAGATTQSVPSNL